MELDKRAHALGAQRHATRRLMPCSPAPFALAAVAAAAAAVAGGAGGAGAVTFADECADAQMSSRRTRIGGAAVDFVFACADGDGPTNGVIR